MTTDSRIPREMFLEGLTEQPHEGTQMSSKTRVLPGAEAGALGLEPNRPGGQLCDLGHVTHGYVSGFIMENWGQQWNLQGYGEDEMHCCHKALRTRPGAYRGLVVTSCIVVVRCRSCGDGGSISSNLILCKSLFT